jgi:hypothetical protein
MLISRCVHMTYDLEGCFVKDGSNGYQAQWDDPCGGTAITACMELVSGVWQPDHDTLVGTESCVPDSICCKYNLTDDIWVPILRFNSYSTLGELSAACCEEEGYCNSCLTSPPVYIELTFAGILNCSDYNSCTICNTTFVLELSYNDIYCNWHYSDANVTIDLALYSTDPHLAIKMSNASTSYPYFWYGIHTNHAECILDTPDTNAINNDLAYSLCGNPPYYGIGCDGNVTIDWNP